jgi:hypothetical protein
MQNDYALADVYGVDARRGALRLGGRRIRFTDVERPRGHPVHSAPAAISKFERVRRTLRALNKIRVFEPNYILRTDFASARGLPLLRIE